MRTVYIDIEGNGLLDTVSKIWCIAAKDVNSGEIFTFHPKIRTACPTCKGSGTCTTPEGVYLCTTCNGDSVTFSGDHTEWESDFRDFFSECEHFIGHNIIGYDAPAIEKVLNLKIPIKDLTDTLVYSKLFRPVTPPNGVIAGSSTDPSAPNYVDNRVGGHGLAAWGKRLGYPKQDFDDWSKYSSKMLAYCINDVELGTRIWEYLELERLGKKDPALLTGQIKDPVPFSDLSIRLEKSAAHYLSLQEQNGFMLDKQAAQQLADSTLALLTDLQAELLKHFPPVEKFVKKWSPKLTKEGALNKVSKRILSTWIKEPVQGSSRYSDMNGEHFYCSYNLYETQEFNPRSGQQVAQRLMDLGWKPKKFTPKGSPATDKESLREAIAELKDKHPEVKALEHYSIVAYNNDKANKWLTIVKDDGRVHGRINHLGAGTHRCTHSDDNMANIASVKHGENGEILKGVEGEYGFDCRSCWTVPEGKVLVGADASGIQLRALAHYMNDSKYTKALLEGDIHTVNQQAAGIKDRPTAKTFIYAWLLGAGDEKIGSIVGLDPSEVSPLILKATSEKKHGTTLLQATIDNLHRQDRKATKETVATCIKGYYTKQQFLDRTPALKRLRTQDIPKATKQGYVVGLDGRKLWIPSEHLAMSLYLQGFEAVVMKAAIACYHDDLNKKGIPFKQVAFVHDEVQIECNPEHADVVGRAVVEGIKKAGRIFKVNCPLDGEYKVGNSWAETH